MSATSAIPPTSYDAAPHALARLVIGIEIRPFGQADENPLAALVDPCNVSSSGLFAHRVEVVASVFVDHTLIFDGVHDAAVCCQIDSDADTMSLPLNGAVVKFRNDRAVPLGVFPARNSVELDWSPDTSVCTKVSKFAYAPTNA